MSKILTSNSKFYLYHKFSIDQLKKTYFDEITLYSNKQWDAPQRAARLAAAVKRYKTSEMLRFIFMMADEKETDLTPTLVKHLCFQLFGRKGSQSVIVDVFGTQGRQHKSKDCNPQKIDELINYYKDQAINFWGESLADIERIKIMYRQEIRNKK